MYNNDIILNKKDNGDVIESSKALSIFNANIATIDYENEQFSGKSVWMKGRLTNITNVDSKDQRFLDKLNKVKFYNHKLYFTTVTNLPLKEGYGYQILGRFEKAYTSKGVYDSFKIEAILNDDFSFETIRNLLTMGSVNKKLADKTVSIYEENNLTPIKSLLDIKNAENSTILSDFTEKEIRFIQKALDTTDNSISETIIKAELTPLFGDNNKFPNRVYERYGFNSLATIKEDPWEMMFTISYATIDICDKVALKLGFEDIENDSRRIKALIRKAFNDAIDSSGHTYLPFSDLEKMHTKYLAQYLTFEELEESLNDKENKLFDFIMKTELGYQPETLFDAEENIYKALINLVQQKIDVPKQKVSNLIKSFEEEKTNQLKIEKNNDSLEFKFAKKQKEAIRKSLESNIFILTGGPGTGKTTTLSSIIRAHQELFDYPPIVTTQREIIRPVLLLAPTGKAANRMSEQTGLEASTIHKQFRIIPDNGCTDIDIVLTSLKTMKTKLIVIDEASMLDTFVAGTVFEIISKYNKQNEESIKLILLGDEDQLPSISAGQVLADLNHYFKDSEFTVHLDEVKRQENGSNIPELASLIAKGEFPDKDWFADKHDISFIDTNSKDIIKRLQQILFAKKSKTGTLSDLQILTPYVNSPRNGIDYGTTNMINHYVQAIYNSPFNGIESEDQLTPDEKEAYARAKFGGKPDKYFTPKIKRFVNHGDKITGQAGSFKEGRLFRTGDKVICNTNKSATITNGTVGTIVKIGTHDNNDVKEWVILVDFGEETYTEFPYAEWEQLSLAYAITIHKSQGSEYKNIIMTLTRPTYEGDHFLNRNILYTGVTRSSKNVILMGDINTYKQASKNIRPHRLTGLAFILKEDRLVEIL